MTKLQHHDKIPSLSRPDTYAHSAVIASIYTALAELEALRAAILEYRSTMNTDIRPERARGKLEPIKSVRLTIKQVLILRFTLT